MISSSSEGFCPPSNERQKIWMPTIVPSQGEVNQTAASSPPVKQGQIAAVLPFVSVSFCTTISSAKAKEPADASANPIIVIRPAFLT